MVPTCVVRGPLPRSTLGLVVATNTPHEPTVAERRPLPTVTVLFQRSWPALSKTARNVSSFADRGPAPRSTGPVYLPVRMMCPAGSPVGLADAKNAPGPPKSLVQRRFPPASKRAMASDLMPVFG